MMRSIRARLDRLEGRARRGGRCGACGGSDAGPICFDIPPPRVLGAPPDPADDPSRDVCAACGRRLVFRVPPPREILPPGAGTWAGAGGQVGVRATG